MGAPTVRIADRCAAAEEPALIGSPRQVFTHRRSRTSGVGARFCEVSAEPACARAGRRGVVRSATLAITSVAASPVATVTARDTERFPVTAATVANPLAEEDDITKAGLSTQRDLFGAKAGTPPQGRQDASSDAASPKCVSGDEEISPTPPPPIVPSRCPFKRYSHRRVWTVDEAVSLGRGVQQVGIGPGNSQPEGGGQLPSTVHE